MTPHGYRWHRDDVLGVSWANASCARPASGSDVRLSQRVKLGLEGKSEPGHALKLKWLDIRCATARSGAAWKVRAWPVTRLRS